MKELVPALDSVLVPKVDFGKNYRTRQIYSVGFEFAFASWDEVEKVFRQACTFVYCKDFLHDAVWAQVNNRPWSIHGFHYTPGEDIPLDFNNCVFLFRNTQMMGREEEMHGCLVATQEFLNEVEAELGFSPSKIFKVPHKAGPCWLIIGDKGWQHAPPLVGLYTLFIRVGTQHKLGTSFEDTLAAAIADKMEIGSGSSYAGNVDSCYIREAEKGIRVILKWGLGVFHSKMEDNYPSKLESFGLHHYFGPVSFAEAASNPTRNAKRAMPFWYREKIWGEK